jgi:hypothetical protein
MIFQDYLTLISQDTVNGGAFLALAHFVGIEIESAMFNYFRRLMQSDPFANRICSDGTIQPTQALRDAHNARINARRVLERELAEKRDLVPQELGVCGMPR